jgi:hypothetical protein
MHATCGSLPPCLVTRRCGTANPKQAGSRCQIKGNISLKGGRLDHVPGSEFYGRRQISVRKGSAGSAPNNRREWQAGGAPVDDKYRRWALSPSVSDHVQRMSSFHSATENSPEPVHLT